MGNNFSVVVNYKSNEILTPDDAPDIGYIQFTRSAARVYISVDGKSVGFVPEDKFAEMASRFSEVTS